MAFDLLDRQMPTWFDEAKLGLFVHWNPAAIPAYAPLTAVAEMEQADWWTHLPYAEMYLNTLHVPGSPTAEYHHANFGEQPYDSSSNDSVTS